MLAIDRESGCWTVSLDRPESANALSSELVEAFITALDDAEAAGVGMVAVRGNGRHFCAGFDFGGYDALSEGDLLQRFVRIETLLQRVARSQCLTVGLAHGRSFGAGVDLLAVCRWRIADPEATFRMPGLAFGLVLGTRRFAALVGRDHAREILESLRTFDAAHAQSIGLLTRTLPVDAWPGLLDEARAAAVALPPESRRMLYRALDDGEEDRDMSLLARSAAAPGLKQRVRRYLESQGKRKLATHGVFQESS